MSLLALTLHRPWVWAIFEAGKDIENRTWRPPVQLVGQRFAIHAGNGWDESGLEFIRDLGYDCPEDPEAHPLGLIGTVKLTGTIETVEPALKERPLLYSKWYMGHVGFMIADPRKLVQPLECRGRQKFWAVPEALARQLL